MATCQFGEFNWILSEYKLFHRCHAEMKRLISFICTS